jgi:hypothetical protein
MGMKKNYFLFLLIFSFFSGSAGIIHIGGSLPGDDTIKMVQFYPNPASTIIYFEFPHNLDKSYSLHIYNFIGKKVAEFQITASKIGVPLDSYYRGLYVFQLRDKVGNILESGKFQVLK